MGNFANTLFSVLLGWVQGAVNWLWRLVASDGADGLMGWVLDNWLVLTVGLCLLGLVVDGIVYLIRWQPYRMWRSFRRRAEQEAATAGELPEPDEELQWVYANGEVATQPRPSEYAPATEMPGEAPSGGLLRRVIPARRHTQDAVRAIADEHKSYHQPYYPPQWRGSEFPHDDGGAQQ